MNEYHQIVANLEAEKVYFSSLKEQLMKLPQEQPHLNEEAMQNDYEMIKLSVENEDKSNLIDDLEQQLLECRQKLAATEHQLKELEDLH
jgi:chromosome segregation ATPase